MNYRNIAYFAVIFGLIILTGFMNSWNVALGLLNMGLISAIMALGVNIQWRPRDCPDRLQWRWQRWAAKAGNR